MLTEERLELLLREAIQLGFWIGQNKHGLSPEQVIAEGEAKIQGWMDEASKM